MMKPFQEWNRDPRCDWMQHPRSTYRYWKVNPYPKTEAGEDSLEIGRPQRGFRQCQTVAASSGRQRAVDRRLGGVLGHSDGVRRRPVSVGREQQDDAVAIQVQERITDVEENGVDRPVTEHALTPPSCSRRLPAP